MMEPFAWLGWWWARVAGQALVCLLLGAWASSRLERSPARSHLVAALALAAALITPLASELVRLSGWGLFTAPAPAEVFRTPNEASPASSLTPEGLASGGLLGLWAGASGLLLGGLVLSFLRGRQLVARSTPITARPLLEAVQSAKEKLGIEGGVELRCSPEVPSPMIWCWGPAPVLLVPDDAADSPEIDWEAVFIHELAHLRRGDHLSALFADMVTALLFWCPVAWWVRGQLLRASEFACDDWVLRAGRSPSQFSQALLSLRWEVMVTGVSAPALLGRRASLKERVVRLLGLTALPPGCGRGWAAVAVALVLSLVCGLAVVQASPRENAGQPAAPKAR
jgi:beta-lactamase regulating signal transducer with metallopeptidase domain